MAYTALYRKFRPLKFSEMVGEEHITRTLKNQIIAGRVGHAYLFNGGRGTGKTSAAKILARAVNCLNVQDGEPCNECEICKAILSGTLSDVVEMDAASNNSVEDIRSIREEVNFLPTIAKYRVYIIDEVHMLSTGAFNSLLKTLEEPPEHVKFILATTEPQKLPATILSRCQRFDFKRISNEDIIKRLKVICEKTNITIEDRALELIAILSEGALRDAISILERCIGEAKEKILEQDIRDLVGIPTFEYINKISKYLIQKHPENIINISEEIINQGKDLDNLLWEIIKYLKDILLYKSTGNINIYTKEETEEINKLSSAVEKQDLLHLIYELSDLANNLKISSQKSILFETGLIKACACNANHEKEDINQIDNKEDTVESNKIIKKAEKIEEQINQKEQKEELKNNIAENTKELKNNPVEKQAEVKKAIKVEEKIEPQEIQEKGNISSNNKYWENVLSKLKSSGKIVLYTNLIGTKAKELNDMMVEISFTGKINPFTKTVIEQRENKEIIEKLLSTELGKVMHIKYNENALNSKNDNNEGNNSDSNSSNFDIPINIIDE